MVKRLLLTFILFLIFLLSLSNQAGSAQTHTTITFTPSIMDDNHTGDSSDTALSVESSAPIDETTPGRSPPPMSVVIWLIIVAIGVLILLGIYYWWFLDNVSDEKERTIQGVGILNPEKQAVYCHECGMRSRPGDHYCSNCGTKLRKPSQFDSLY